MFSIAKMCIILCRSTRRFKNRVVVLEWKEQEGSEMGSNEGMEGLSYLPLLELAATILFVKDLVIYEREYCYKYNSFIGEI